MANQIHCDYSGQVNTSFCPLAFYESQSGTSPNSGAFPEGTTDKSILILYFYDTGTLFQYATVYTWNGSAWVATVNVYGQYVGEWQTGTIQCENYFNTWEINLQNEGYADTPNLENSYGISVALSVAFRNKISQCVYTIIFQPIP